MKCVLIDFHTAKLLLGIKFEGSLRISDQLSIARNVVESIILSDQNFKE